MTFRVLGDFRHFLTLRPEAPGRPFWTFGDSGRRGLNSGLLHMAAPVVTFFFIFSLFWRVEAGRRSLRHVGSRGLYLSECGLILRQRDEWSRNRIGENRTGEPRPRERTLVAHYFHGKINPHRCSRGGFRGRTHLSDFALACFVRRPPKSVQERVSRAFRPRNTKSIVLEPQLTSQAREREKHRGQPFTPSKIFIPKRYKSVSVSGTATHGRL